MIMTVWDTIMKDNTLVGITVLDNICLSVWKIKDAYYSKSVIAYFSQNIIERKVVNFIFI